MVKDVNFFKAFGFVTGACAREAKQHEEFLAFYKTLVEACPPEISRSFGSVSVAVKHEKESWRLELTPGDFLWWREKIKSGARVQNGVSSVKAAIFAKIANMAASHAMTPEERREFLALFDNA